MSTIKLERRYPESKPEDITDAYMRGVEFGRALGHDELRELIQDLWPRAAFTMTKANRDSWIERMDALGIEVTL